MEDKQAEEVAGPTELPLAYQIFALSLQQPGAIEYFQNHLPVSIVKSSGQGHAEFYSALLDFYDKTGADPIDRVSFRSWLENETLIYDALGGATGVSEYLDTVLKVELSTPEAVSAILRFRHNRERQATLALELTELVNIKELTEARTENITEITKEIGQLSQGTRDPMETIYDGNRIADLAESLWELPDFLPTPFKSLNKAMGYKDDAGFCKGAVHAILAASGKGKSTFAKCLMNHWVDTGHTVLYVNYEEATAHWNRVLFTQLTKYNVYKGGVTQTEMRHYNEIFKEKMRKWNGRFLVKHDPDTPYFEDIENWIRDSASRGVVPDVIILDTIQSMFLKGGKNLPRWGQYEEMMVRLEKLAKDLGSAIIITAQENSNRMKEKREVVQQSDIGGSLAIAQKCSITIFITDAQTETGDDSIDENIMQLQIPKNRITGVSFMTDPPLVQYNDEIKSYLPYDLVDSSPYDSSVVLDSILNDDGGFH